MEPLKTMGAQPSCWEQWSQKLARCFVPKLNSKINFDHPNGGQKTTSGSRIKLLTKVFGKEPGD